MSYKLNSPLSEENYNRILTALDTDLNKEFFTSLFNEESNEELNSDSFHVSILSTHEYEKYLLNGNLNGSIVPRNYNTWNFAQNGRVEAFGLSVRQYAAGSIQYMQSVLRPTIKNDLGETYASMVDERFWFSEISSITGTFPSRNMELVQNNNSSSCKGRSYLELFVFCYTDNGAGYGGYGGYGYGVLNYLNLNNINIPKTNAKYNVVNSGTRHVDRYNYTFTSTIPLNICFRPVFRFKNNKKSKNCYY